MNEQYPIITFRDIEGLSASEPGGVTAVYDQALERLGGRAFRDQALKAAGWDAAMETSITEHSERAARSYMIIRAVLMKNLDCGALINEINFVRAVRDI